MTRGWQRAAGGIAVLAVAVWAWYTWWPSDERAIRRQLGELADTVNEEAPEGLGAVTRAAQIGTYFTQDVVVDFGRGSAPIHGRETLIGLAARLPASDGYSLAFDDVAVDVRGEDTADVSLAATLSRRRGAPDDRSADTRELQIGMAKADGVWRIARVDAVDVLRRE